ncbi:MAG: AAA family ATPase [Arcicella sp.]|jgi:predicted ATPase|nr:AAA family ATPase [Arcicella sp.]
MTKAEEIRLHNLFIKFKNEGKELEDIKNLLGVDGEILIEWDNRFKIQKELIQQQENPFITEIVGLEDNGEYIYNNSFEFQLTQLQKVKYDLFRMINSIKEGETETDFQKKAKKYLPIFDMYFEELKINEVTENNFTVSYKLSNSTDNIATLAEEAVKFYLEISKLQDYYLKSFLIKSFSKDLFRNSNKILPYSLKSLSVKKYSGIEKTSFEGLAIDTNWIFLIGENGYGKTSLLRSITIGFIGGQDDEADLFKPDFQSGIGIEYFNLNHSIINNIGQNTFKPFPHLACYGPSRLQIQTEQTQNDVAKKSTTTYSLFNSDGVLLNIEFELLIWFLEKNPRFDAVKQTFLKLIPYLSDIQVDVPKRKVFYIEKEPIEDGVKYNPVTFNELASGFRSILAMVGDMMIRLFKSQPDITEPSELAGIVIIDEIDLHWHPKMQREIPALLSSIFPKVQFIVSTHSLVPLLGAPENSVLLKVNRTVEEGITVEKMDIDFQALSSDVMLRDIFDLEKYQSDAKQKAWERYTKLKGLIHFEKDEIKKRELIHEREILGDKYNFTL